MAEHGILMRDEMVRALLREPGDPLRKTVTRRTSDQWASRKVGDLLWVKRAHPLRHGDRVAYAAGPHKRKLELVKNEPHENPGRVWFHYDLGTVVFEEDRSHRRGRACVIWDDAEVNVDDVVISTGLLWEGSAHFWRDDGCAYAVVTPESRRTTREQRRWRAAEARQRLERFLKEDEDHG